MKKIFLIAMVAALLGPVSGLGATQVSVATGPWGGVYFLVGTALANVLSKHMPGVKVVAEPATGSAHGLELVDAGDATIGFVGLSTAYFGVRGQREFDRKYDHVGFVMAAMDTGQSLVTLAESGVKTFADIKGLRVAVNTPTSKVQLLAALKPYGLKEADVQLTVMNYTEQISALREGTIDAGFIAVSPRNTDVVSLASEQRIRILGFEPATAKMFEEYPFWTPVAVKAGTYPGLDHDVLVPGAHTTILAHKAADPALIYQIVRTVVERGAEFGDLHQGGREFTIEKTRYFVDKRLVPTSFHPGAERYWREKGVLK
jgi:TRAP transporter TAXI family solute receptor